MIKLPGNPSKKRVALLAVGGGFTLILIAVLVVYFVLFPTSSPKPFTLATSTAASTGGTSAASTSTVSAGGHWSIAAGSEAGYRVREKLGFLPAQSDAVGRTSSITGTAALTESKGTIAITSASFDVAVNTLKSDRSMRDEKSMKSAWKATAIRAPRSCSRRPSRSPSARSPAASGGCR